MKKNIIRIISIILIVFTSLGCIPSFTVSAKTDYFAQSADILNNVKLYPQKTGFMLMDKTVENFLSSFKGKCATTSDLVQSIYDWFVNNMSYKLGSYYPTYDYNSRNEIPIPFYVLYFGYCPFVEKTGVCDNFSSAFMIAMRAIGLDAYIRTGKMYTSSTVYDHVWVEILINGKYYIFDPQVEHNVTQKRGVNKHSYYCVPREAFASTYVKNESRCAAYDAATVPVSQTKNAFAYVGVRQNYNGTVKTSAVSAKSVQKSARIEHFNKNNYGYKFAGWLNDSAVCRIGSIVSVTAYPDSGNSFIGWYINNKLVSTQQTFSYTVYGDTYIEALFTGDRFGDVMYGKWYYEPIYFCFNNNLMTGTSTVTFSPDAKLTRAMAVTVLSKLSGDDLSSFGNKSHFWDVNIGSYYAKSVEWAYKNGITSGTENGFAPNKYLTREQFVLFAYKYCQYKKISTLQRADVSSYWDYWTTHTWARDAMSWALSIGLISGTSEHFISPTAATTRAQAAVVIKKLSNIK